MPRLYRLQQRLALTSAEASALLFVAVVALVGLTAQHLDAQRAAFGPDHYAALYDELAARSAPADSTEADSTAADSVAATAEAPARIRSAKPGPVRMNLNTASAGQLQRLPRIGPKMAERVIAYREEHGPFARASHVVRVRGIGAKTFEQLEPYLFVDEADLGGVGLASN